MRFNNISTLLVLLILFCPLEGIAQNGVQLLKEMDAIIGAGKDRTATVEIVTTDKSGKQKIREASMKQLGRYKKLFRYTKPEKQAGIATLTLPDDIIWMYMPAFGKPIKITLLSKSQAFTGTDFSHEDMSGTPFGDRYNPQLLDSEDVNTYLISLRPKTDKSKYTKIIVTLDKTNKFPLEMKYFNKNDDYFKTATYNYKKFGKYWYAENVLMTDHKKQHSTAITLKDLKFDTGLKDDEFLVEKLKN
ncbi:outer membrane lipoprotein-sorting protein [Urechidicola vernalis]|uniref:Outer membrane lipoprotein-sorting protein n=1 Tax=Urechidicola vernalis TaxID=3075600 RepID=A0ABU2Y122_9FLAO|nr:outer membrane lipoprotein-sorting protein [Urechidicola sp. P050]MDT0551889.1 outer membrane lipoprotein-sorting protein [Urechidicola sp. P050]